MVSHNESRVCPLCGSGEPELTDIIPTSKLVAQWARGFNIDVSDSFHGRAEIFLYECRQCALRYFGPSDLAGDGRLYEQLARFPWYYMPWKWEHEAALRRIRPTDRVLEVGSGEGSFVHRLRDEKGLDACGIELNEASAAAARNNGIPVDVMDVRDLAERSPSQFDVVCAFQVLEHLANPREFLSASIRLLRPGGRLLLCVPNHDSFLRHQWNLLDMPPHHMSQWTRRTFQSLQQFFPVRLIGTEREPLASYHVKGFVTAYARYYGSRSLWNRVLWNPLTRLAVRGSMQAGLRRWMTGQSLFAELSYESCAVSAAA